MAGSMKQIAKRNAMSPQALVSEWDFFCLWQRQNLSSSINQFEGAVKWHVLVLKPP